MYKAPAVALVHVCLQNRFLKADVVVALFLFCFVKKIPLLNLESISF